MKKIYIFSYLTLAAAIVLFSCSKPAEVANPYDSIHNTSTAKPVEKQPDSNSITGIYTFILSKKCAIPSCHGKSFEPDFSSVEASYNTLVNRMVIKNTADKRFMYRVVPGDTTKSWLHERLVTDDSILGRMPRYMPPLTPNEMKHINQWIMDGAKNANGTPASLVNNNIQVGDIVVYDALYKRWDTTRTNYNSPFYMPSNSLMHVYFYLYDVESKVDLFLDNKVKFSTDPNDFSKANELPAILDTTYHIWHMDINSNSFPKNKHIYVRYYGRDPDHKEVAEYPNNNSQSYNILHYSFFVK